jgi:hypothetical protein
VGGRVLAQWMEMQQIASSISFTDEPDTMIWHFNSSGRYSVQSLYGIVTDRGVRQIFTPVVWKITVPPRIHIFLWLLAKNKILTRDNLDKRRKLDDLTCLFCSEPETAHHLFFECCVAHSIWSIMSKILGISVGRDFESIAKLWLRDKQFKYINMCNAAVLWTLWKTRMTFAFRIRTGEGQGRYLGDALNRSRAGACWCRKRGTWTGWWKIWRT